MPTTPQEDAALAAAPVSAVRPAVAAALPLAGALGAPWGVWPMLATSLVLMVGGTAVLLTLDVRDLRRRGEAPRVEWLGIVPTYAIFTPCYLRQRARLSGIGRWTTWCWWAAFAVWVAAMVATGAWAGTG